MLKKFTVSNFKNFKDEISLDFSKIGEYSFNMDSLSMRLIYGRNATGKTNFGRALLDIKILLYGMQSSGLINEDGAAKFKYEFKFGNDEVVYKYSRFSNTELCDEELYINGEAIIKCDFKNSKFDFQGLSIISAETVNTNRYVNKDEMDNEYVLPFLRWLINNTAFSDDSVLIQLFEYVRKMDMITVGHDLLYSNRNFFENLKNPAYLHNFEDFLNLMGIECKLVLQELPDGQVELYFSQNKLVPFYSTASSGTLALTSLYQKIVSNLSLIYLDDFAAFYHYEMAEKLICYFKDKYPECQFIMTSHNTNLMTNKIMRPDCLFILSSKGTLTALCDATERELREGHNLEKMYISGEFEKCE
ncbi:ATP-binding protein [Holdemanella biformis]|uniref:ATP-binding protein n=1 Tax=Holdemanella biformis TaxID=1735 RepID=A0A413CV97_9FIRM|nr:AAA family ATPase [Holdemanella biformis]RGW75522.1 ATP-binding protein [Holdemanella biformis]